MWKTIIKLIPAICSGFFWGGLQMSGIVIPWLGYSLMVLAVLFLIIPGWPLLKRIFRKTPQRGKQNGLQIRFCDGKGNFIDYVPTAQFWEWSGGSICFLVDGLFRLSNHTSEERTLEDAYVVLKAGDEELKRVTLQNFPAGERIQSFHTTQTPIAFHAQPFVDRIKLEQLIGHKFEDADVALVVQATGATAKVKFKSHYQEV